MHHLLDDYQAMKTWLSDLVIMHESGYLLSNQTIHNTKLYCKTRKFPYGKQLILVNFVNCAKLRELVFTKGFFTQILLNGRPQFTQISITNQESCNFNALRNNPVCSIAEHEKKSQDSSDLVVGCAS